jgi:putative SOS response-associated peptidase YedK
VILDRTDWERWLHAPLEELRLLDRHYPAERMDVLKTEVPWKDGGNTI